MTQTVIALQEICKAKGNEKTFKPFISKTLDNKLCKECRPLKLTCMFLYINCGSNFYFVSSFYLQANIEVIQQCSVRRGRLWRFKNS